MIRGAVDALNERTEEQTVLSVGRKAGGAKK